MTVSVEFPLLSRKSGGTIGKIRKVLPEPPSLTDLRIAIEEKGFDFWDVKIPFNEIECEELTSPMYDNYIDIRVLESQVIHDEKQDAGYPVTIHRVSDSSFSDAMVREIIQEEGCDPKKVDYYHFSIPFNCPF